MPSRSGGCSCSAGPTRTTARRCTTLRNLLWWAVVHDQRDRVILLATHGVDIELPLTEQRAGLAGHRTPAEEALVNGHPEVAALLLRLGAGTPRLSPHDAFVAAALAGDAAGVSRTGPAVIAAVREARPGLITWAASQGAPGAVELLAGVGFDLHYQSTPLGWARHFGHQPLIDLLSRQPGAVPDDPPR